MAIVGPDGTPTEAGSKLLLAIRAGFTTPDSIAQASGLPAIIVKNGLHDMERARLIKRNAEGYVLDDRGLDLLK